MLLCSYNKFKQNEEHLNNKISTKNIYGETCGKIEIGKHMGVIMYNV